LNFIEIESEPILHAETQPITALVNNAVEKGAWSGNIEPMDLLRALSGVATIRASENWKRSAGQIMDLLLVGMTAQTVTHGR
jgi:hypothetical protein